MGLFKKKSASSAFAGTSGSANLAQRALDYITDGVMLVDSAGMIQFANPAAAAMTGYDAPSNITGLDYQLVIRLETADEKPIEPTQTELYTAIHTNQAMTTRDYLLVAMQTDRRTAIALSCIPTGGANDYKIVTFRDITKELAEENEQAEFISTASHEMRTPVASIEGYLGLALNPQTATIDARAKQYLEAAHAASEHLGHLFKDLLDVTKLDDNRLKAHLVPVDAVEIVKHFADAHAQDALNKQLKYSFGTSEAISDKHKIEPKVYMAVDLDFLREIMDNLIENAIKYTPSGGNIWVNVRGDGDKVLINVTDSGIGVSAEDAGHIFQKFYRVDNSQTRQIGGTGLGLYLVKQRVEALGGRVWVESSFGDGSTFYVSLPRISDSDFEKMSIAYANEKMVQNFQAPTTPQQPAPVQPAPVAAVPTVAPAQPATVATVPTAAPVQPAAAQPAPTVTTVAAPQPTIAPVVALTAAQQPTVAPVVAGSAAAPVAINQNLNLGKEA